MSAPNGLQTQAEASFSNNQSNGHPANATANGAAPSTSNLASTANGTSAPAQGDDETQVPDMNQLYQARRDEEAARKDRSLAEFLVMLDGYKPLVSCHFKAEATIS